MLLLSLTTFSYVSNVVVAHKASTTYIHHFKPQFNEAIHYTPAKNQFRQYDYLSFFFSYKHNCFLACVNTLQQIQESYQVVVALHTLSKHQRLILSHALASNQDASHNYLG